MLPSDSSEAGLLKTLLEPLLEDFKYWFSRSQQFLETETISFLSPHEQSDLLARVRQAQQEVDTVSTLLQVTDNQVGVETQVLFGWHRLLAECWKVSARFRTSQSLGKG